MRYTQFFIAFIFLYCLPLSAIEMSEDRYEMLLGIKGQKSSLHNQWDKKFNSRDYLYGKSPVKFLANNYDYIPAGSTVLDVGMGEGRNAVFLARKGYNVTGVDISSIAIRKARALGREFGVNFKAINSTMDKYRPKAKFDAIIVFYYLDRELNKKLKSWLKPKGILIFATHTELQKRVQDGDEFDSEYLLKRGELLHMFKGFRILHYQEPQHMKNYSASIILQKKN